MAAVLARAFNSAISAKSLNPYLTTIVVNPKPQAGDGRFLDLGILERA
jgi:hypothetical protein